MDLVAMYMMYMYIKLYSTVDINYNSKYLIFYLFSLNDSVN